MSGRIMISGAGMAGLTLAYWLRQFGFDPMLVEKRPNMDDEDYMIDFYGSGFDVAERMQLLEALQVRHYPIPKLEFVDKDGHTRASLDVQEFRKLLGFRHYNFMRGDLEEILYASVGEAAPIRFGVYLSKMLPPFIIC